MAGNVVMVKHASNVPQAAAAFEQLLLEAGAPARRLHQPVRHQGSALAADRRPAGARSVADRQRGRRGLVAARAGKNLKKSTMELGGSDALIALADADVDKTVAWARHGRIFNGGQCCVASKRIIVVDEIADEFLDRIPGRTVRAQGRRSVRPVNHAAPDVQLSVPPTICTHRSTPP